MYENYKEKELKQLREEAIKLEDKAKKASNASCEMRRIYAQHLAEFNVGKYFYNPDYNCYVFVKEFTKKAKLDDNTSDALIVTRFQYNERHNQSYQDSGYSIEVSSKEYHTDYTQNSRYKEITKQQFEDALHGVLDRIRGKIIGDF